jgi:hypothetical protein
MTDNREAGNDHHWRRQEPMEESAGIAAARPASITVRSLREYHAGIADAE